VAISIIGAILFAYNSPFIRKHLDTYAISMVEKQFGSKQLAPVQEAKIVALAEEMGITDKIVIRKMNTSALQTFGYYNAFAYTAQFANFIPISNQPFIFVSAGFLEDLTDAEQRFLIGHELIHAKYRHLQFANITRYLILILIMMFLLWIPPRVRFIFGRNKVLGSVFFIGLLYFMLSVLGLSNLAYRRHVEWVADKESIALLDTSNGCIEFLDRCQNKFKMPKHNKYDGWLADHPSPYERQQYCLRLQKNNNLISGIYK
jgi:Zn-dependent protease with chaperone function